MEQLDSNSFGRVGKDVGKDMPGNVSFAAELRT